MFSRFFDQVAAQLAPQFTALTSVMQRLETLHHVTPPSRSRRPVRQQISASRPSSQRASPSPQRPPHRQSALEAGALKVCPFLLPRSSSLWTLALRRTSWHLPRASRLLCRWVRPSSRISWPPSHSLPTPSRRPRRPRCLRCRRIPQKARSRGFCSRRSLFPRCLSHRFFRCLSHCFTRIYSTFYSTHRAHRASRVLSW